MTRSSPARVALVCALALACAAPGARAQDAPIDFQGLIARAMAVYVPRLAAQGITLSFVETHEDMIKGAAYRDDPTHAHISFDVGYYTDPLVKADGFLFAVCHELGHVVAGAPHRGAPREWDGPTDKNGDLLLSCEGQADYYAASKCMRMVLAGDDNAAYMRSHPAPPSVVARCARQFPGAADAALCERIALAGKNFLDSFAIPVATSFDKPAPERPDQTVLYLPTPQCRLDTILAGALCTAPKDAAVDPYDPAAGSCTSQNDPLGARPACWFRE